MSLKRIVLATSLLLAMPAAALACPNPNLTGQALHYTASELYNPESFRVLAGGAANLANCNAPGQGHVASAPDFELYYDGSESYDLEIRVNSNCDSILLVNDPYGDWFYDDDSNGNSDAGIHINGADGGIYDIWIGTYDPGNCDASMTLETF